MNSVLSPWPDYLQSSNDNYALWSPGIPSDNLVNVAQRAQVNDDTPILATHEAVDSDMRDREGKTSLHRAVISGSVKDVEDLLCTGAAVEARDDQGNQPLHYAAARGFTAIVGSLMRRGAQVDAKGAKGETPVHLALSFPKSVTVLLRRDPVLSIVDDKGDTALHLAVAKSIPDAIPNRIIKNLIDSGADVNQPNASGVTPFHMAVDRAASARKGHDSCLSLFLEHDANIDLNLSDGRRPFKVFLDRSSPGDLWTRETFVQNKEFRLFIQKGADPDTTLESDEPCLYSAFRRFSLRRADRPLIDKLIEVVDVDKRTTNGDSYLHQLIRLCQVFLYDRVIAWFETLLRRGADPNGLNNARESPLTLLLDRNACKYSAGRMMKILLDNDADEMQRTDAGELPLHLAYKNYNGLTRETLIRLLVESFIRRPSIEIRQSERMKNRSGWIAYHSLYTTKRWCTSTCHAAFNHVDSGGAGRPLAAHLIVLAAEDILQNVKANL